MVVVQQLLRWLDNARVADRANAATALARAFLDGSFSFEDRCSAEAALTLLLDDPSPKVRQALAEAFSLSHRAPAQIVMALAADQTDVAAPILVRSPLLTDGDLVDLVASAPCASQRLIAMRSRVAMTVSAAIAEIGEAEACVELIGNSGAEIASLSFRRMVERYGDHAWFREVLISDQRLPPDCRHSLLVKTGDALCETPLVVALMGRGRAERVAREACIKSSLTLIEKTAGHEHLALVEHLRLRGDLTLGFIVRAAAHGKIDFFAAVLVSLTGQAPERVRAMLANGRDGANAALFRKAGLSATACGPILKALQIWRAVALGRRVAGAQEVSWLMLRELGEAANARDGEASELAALLKRVHLEALRENARGEALAIAAA